MDIGNIFEEWDFSGAVPLPYRVMLMGCVGIFAWAANLHILSYLRVDVSSLITPSNSHHHPHHHSSHHHSAYVGSDKHLASYRSLYGLGLGFLAMTLGNMWMYKWVISGDGNSTDLASSGFDGGNNPIVNQDPLSGGGGGGGAMSIKGGMGVAGDPRAGIFVPIFGLFTLLALLFMPANQFFKKDRFKFLRSMKKVCFSGLSAEVTFGDVILADILTSFARVFGDLAVTLCLMFLDRDGSRDESCYSSMLVPIMTSIPYCIRLRQCVGEYLESKGTNRRHLMNALKYATAFPVILISYIQKSSRQMDGDKSEALLSDASHFRLWLFFVALNSFYSYYWDIKHDWGLLHGSAYTPLPLGTVGGHVRGNTGSNITLAASSVPATATTSSSLPYSPSSANFNFEKIRGTSTPPTSGGSASSIGSGSGAGAAAQTLSLQQQQLLSAQQQQQQQQQQLQQLQQQQAAAALSLPGGSPLTATSPSPSQQLGAQSSWVRRFLRPVLHYEVPWFYVFAAVVDLLLRTTWMLKLFEVRMEEYEGGVFTMECLEVLRRWIWVLFRFESEMVKRYMMGYYGKVGGVGVGGIPMEELENWQQ